MRRVLVTGMSGTGKSTALAELAKCGFQVVETDDGPWSEWSEADDGYVWREDLIEDLLSREDERRSSSPEPSPIRVASIRASTRSVLERAGRRAPAPYRDAEVQRLRQGSGACAHPPSRRGGRAVATCHVHTRDRRGAADRRCRFATRRNRVRPVGSKLVNERAGLAVPAVPQLEDPVAGGVPGNYKVEPDWREGAAWGDPRPGHPEGSVQAHIEDVLANVDRVAVDEPTENDFDSSR